MTYWICELGGRIISILLSIVIRKIEYRKALFDVSGFFFKFLHPCFNSRTFTQLIFCTATTTFVGDS